MVYKPGIMQVDDGGSAFNEAALLDIITKQQVAAGVKSTDPSARIGSETASQANARITQAYKDQPQPELTKEGAAAGATIEWVRTGAGGVGEYKEVFPIGVPIPQARTTAYGNTYDQQGNLISGTGLKTTSGSGAAAVTSGGASGGSVTGSGGQWIDKNGQVRGDYGPLLNAAMAAGMPVKLMQIFKKEYDMSTLAGQYQAIQDWAFQSGDAGDLAGGKAFIELLGRDRIAKILQGDASWNQGFTDNYGQPVAGSPAESRPYFQPYTGTYTPTELTDPSKTLGAGLKGKSLYSFDPKNPSGETNTYTFPNGFRGTNAEYKAQFGEDPNTILEVGSPEYIKLAQSGATGIATTTGQGYTAGTGGKTTLPYTAGTGGFTSLPTTSGTTGTPNNPYTYGTKQYDQFEKRASAYDTLYNEFNKYGLGSMVERVKGLITDANASPSQFSLALQNTPEYQQRFAANQDRIKLGLQALTPAEYIGLEDQYQNIMRNYGLPASYYSKDTLGTQSGFNKLLSNDVSAAELEDRIATAQQRVQNSNPEVLQALKQFYPDISNADILSYALDPQNALTNIKRKVTAAEIGGAALAQGLQAQGGTAESLAGYGITKAQAQQGYANVAEMLPRGSQLADIYGQQPYTQQTAEAEVFNTAGAADAATRRKKLTALEQAQFGGSSGVGALGRDKAIYGGMQGQAGLY